MTGSDRPSPRSQLARLGFGDTDSAERGILELESHLAAPRDDWLADAEVAADPDGALRGILRVARRSAEAVATIFREASSRRVLWALTGASGGFADFYLRHPEELGRLASDDASLPDASVMRRELLASVDAVDGFARIDPDAARMALRTRYRSLVARIAAVDLLGGDSVALLPDVAAALADAAAAALEASLAVARARLHSGPRPRFTFAEAAATRLAIIGMGKAGARELNYVSDVDVIFVCEAGPAMPPGTAETRLIDIATALAQETMRTISTADVEPPLWEVDANLRPEGKQGALVRTLESHVAYYQRWASGWEFQALLKARPIAGDEGLGLSYLEEVQPLLWGSVARENFVDGVQRMRERVTEHIPADQAPYEIKLGAGGIRDVEFTVQLLQLVHGVSDENIRQRGTLPALDALVREGYIGRTDAASFARDYRILRVLEHRVQLRDLRRTHLMPDRPDELRILARASGLTDTAESVWELWESVKREVRDIHVRLFYRPLLSAVAAIPASERVLSSEQAHDRLAAIGFQDPAGALRHIGALTTGITRKATIQRHLMPVMLRWFADGVDPDYGLLAFRRISERLGDTPWFLRMLRDTAGAAESLSRVLAGSRYVGDLMEWIPESVAWLADDELLRPRSAVALQEEARAIQTRHDAIEDAMRAVRALRRRELLRTAIAAVSGVLTIEDLAEALTTITEVTIQATLRAVRREEVPEADDALDFAVIAMGRFGGRELGFGSDADVMYVYRPNGVEPSRAHELSLRLVAGLRAQSEDQRVPLELDANLRPEGRNGPLVRSLDAYRDYYHRWSMSWEAQALLRARGVAGSVKLIREFEALADQVRYPLHPDPQGIREIKRIKARVENERLPQGTDPARHLKLGPGGLSDVEWLVQLLQLQHAHEVPALRTTSTIAALRGAADAGLIDLEAARVLGESWRLASRLRSANTLLSAGTSDVLPVDRRRLDGIGRILNYPPRSASEVEEDWMAASRRARRVFTNLFYG